MQSHKQQSLASCSVINILLSTIHALNGILTKKEIGKNSPKGNIKVPLSALESVTFHINHTPAVGSSWLPWLKRCYNLIHYVVKSCDS